MCLPGSVRVIRHDLDMAAPTPEQAPSESKPLTRPLATFTKDHLTLVLGGIPIALVVVRLMLFSRGDATVMAALVQNANISTVLISTLTGWFPIALFAIGLWLHATGNLQRWLPDAAPPLENLFLLVWGSLVLFTVMLLPWRSALVWVGAVLLIAIWETRGVRRAKRQGKPRPRRQTDPLAYITVLVAGLMTMSPWMPIERIVLQNGSTRVGYVLHEGDPAAVLWREGGLTYLRQADLKDRQPCSVGDGDRGILTSSRDMTPKCPEHKITPAPK